MQSRFTLGSGFGSLRHGLAVACLALGVIAYFKDGHAAWQTLTLVAIALIASSICSRVGLLLKEPTPEHPPTTAGKSERTTFSI